MLFSSQTARQLASSGDASCIHHRRQIRQQHVDEFAQQQVGIGSSVHDVTDDVMMTRRTSVAERGTKHLHKYMYATAGDVRPAVRL